MPEEILAGDTENIVGALTSALMQRSSRGMPAGGARRQVTRPQFNQTLLQAQVGGTTDNALQAPLGMGFFVFAAGSGNSHLFIVEPQEAFRVSRVVVDVAKSALVGATLVGFEPLTIGTMPQAPSVEFDIPAVMWSADATNAEIDTQICPAGTKIQLRCNLAGAALAEGDSIIVQVGLRGTWIRG